MIHILLGFKTHNRNEVPTVIHVGDDVPKGLDAGKAYLASHPDVIRVGIIRNPQLTMMPAGIRQEAANNEVKKTAAPAAVPAKAKK